MIRTKGIWSALTYSLYPCDFWQLNIHNDLEWTLHCLLVLICTDLYKKMEISFHGVLLKVNIWKAKRLDK